MIIGHTICKRYQIVQKLGQGGFGETYLAKDTQLPGNPVCVVKKLQPLVTEPQHLQIAKRLFDTEAEVLYKLGKHNQIPQLFAHLQENQEFYLVQEYIEGHELTQEIKPGKRFSETEVIKLLQEILTVLEFVHQQRVIHRDIKPSNLIRRTSDGKIVLIDFGAVKEIQTQLNPSPGQASGTIPIGTPGYMPNEQEKGHPKLCSDIYAVGMIGIQALTGVDPDEFTIDPNTLEIKWKNRLSISPKLANILDVMVRYHFTQRYQSATEALQALKSLQSPTALSQTIPFSPASSPKSIASPPQKPNSIVKPKLLLGLVSLGILVGIIVVVIFNLSHLNKPRIQTPPIPSPRITF